MKYKYILSAILAFAIVLALLPATVIYEVGAAAYTVLYEPEKHGMIVSNIDDSAVVRNPSSSPFLIRYTGSGIEVFEDQYSEIYSGSTNSNYALVVLTDSSNNRIYKIIDKNAAELFSFSAPRKSVSVTTSISPDGQNAYMYVSNRETGNDGFFFLDMNNISSDSSETFRKPLPAGPGEGYLHGVGGGYILTDVWSPNDERFAYCFLTPDGENTIGSVYSYANPFSHGYTVVKTVGEDVYKIIDTSGAVVGNAGRYSSYGAVSDNGLIGFRTRDDKYGYMNLDGEVIIDPQNDYGSPFSNGYAVVTRGDYLSTTETGLIDAQGNVVIPFGKYKSLTKVSSSGILWAEGENGKLAILRVRSDNEIEDAPVQTKYPKIPSGVKYVPYASEVEDDYTLTADASIRNQLYYELEGALPQGLSMDTQTSLISGVPLEEGTWDFTVKRMLTGSGGPDSVTELQRSLVILSNTDTAVQRPNDYEIIQPVGTPDGRDPKHFYKDAYSEETMRINGPYEEFYRLYIDGTQLSEPADYTSAEGSTVITIHAQTFQRFGEGTHTIAAEFRPSNNPKAIKRVAQNYTLNLSKPTVGGSSGGASGGGGSSGGHSKPSINTASASSKSAITIPAFANGSVICEPSNASAGETVTLTAVPDPGFALSSLAVRDNAGNEVPLTSTGANTHTFTMPSSAVSVSAEFLDTEIQFYDVSPGAWYYEPVKWALGEGITKGVSKREFAPDQSCTRAQLVTFLWNAAGRPEPSGDGKAFRDVAQESYYAKAVQWASAQGITKGVGGKSFAPDRTITRGDAVNMLYSMAGKPEVTAENTFTDIDARYEPAVLWASANGVTSYKTKFSPGSSCTRAQIVTFLYRMQGS